MAGCRIDPAFGWSRARRGTARLAACGSRVGALNMNVLVSDGGVEAMEGVVETLTELGHVVWEIGEAEQATKLLNEEPIQWVFLGMHDIDQRAGELIRHVDAECEDCEVVVFSPEPSVAEAVEAMRCGAVDFVPLPCSRRRVENLLERLGRSRKERARLGELTELLERDTPPLRFESEDESMTELLERAAMAAETPTTILLLGESGTGKSVLARSIHESSPWSDGPFVTISCPSLSKELLESELFGHRRGAFTGAHRDQFGKVAAAEGGTLFLDEIGELPLELQPKLLRLLQEREYERLGESRTRKAELRVIAATNRDLAAAVERGDFREDLYYRLDVVSLEIPPLRERPRDLERIAGELLEFYARRFGREVEGFGEAALEEIRQHRWPGNLRELDNAIERAVIFTKGGRIECLGVDSERESGGERLQVGEMVTLEELERRHIESITRRTRTLEEASRVLGINKSTLFRKRKRFG